MTQTKTEKLTKERYNKIKNFLHAKKQRFYIMEQTGFDNFYIEAYTPNTKIIITNLNNNNTLDTITTLLAFGSFEYIDWYILTKRKKAKKQDKKQTTHNKHKQQQKKHSYKYT